MKLLNKTLFIFVGMLFIVSCGYKPSVHAIKNVFTDKIYVEVNVDRVEPENAPFVKDEMNRLVYNRFKSRVTSKEESTSSIIVSYSGSTFYPLAFSEGYVTRYRAYINVQFDMKTKDGNMKKSIRSIVESDIEASSLESSTLRTEAIRTGLEKGLDEFLAFIAAKGTTKQ